MQGISRNELAQDNDGSELVLSGRLLSGVALGLFTAMVTWIIPTFFPDVKLGNDA